MNHGVHDDSTMSVDVSLCCSRMAVDVMMAGASGATAGTAA